jgi:hypothetical protein
MSSRTVGNGHIDSADIQGVVVLVGGGGADADAMSEADGLGDTVGEAAAALVADPGLGPNFCFLMASAWRFGGPRRRLGRS